ncbi:bifunctional phosphopantothenoylcysteine decarboxylase/phosphopantothenate--cysteine ligase CoaBC [Virgibacillus sp. W0430]|uniref:bifunctional phosphopantothenoylcysteine decarboxylase/phosphopantothenate--cysteine ligase CoaBC n=1 Tax=Virgibacillus sp. W0430 TaxID=3391580 RepID=UPI003F4514D3
MRNKKVVLGVTGGIAAYKACDLTSKLIQSGAHVKVVMTKSALEFVSPLTFQALSRNPVHTAVFDEKDPQKIAHIDLADWADIVIIAPATANLIGKLSNGLGDDMLTTILLATKAPVYIAPAMNVNMYAHPAIKANMEQLAAWGYNFIEPQAGFLACGWIGKGRLEEPQTIIDAISTHMQRDLLLTGKHVLISAGPTREKVDPVRFFTNRSSGKMGFAFAEVAAQLGATVTIVSGPVSLRSKHPSINRVDVTTAEEMYEAMHHHFHAADIVIKAAAVADYRPKKIYDEKMKKQPGDLHIEMIRTKDILQSLGAQKKHQFLVGFAAETENPIENGKGKLERKNLDAIVVNDVKMKGAGFAGDTNVVTYIDKTMQTTEIPLASKHEIAEKVFEKIIYTLNQGEK